VGIGRIFHGNSTWIRPHGSWLLHVQWVPTGGEEKEGRGEEGREKEGRKGEGRKGERRREGRERKGRERKGREKRMLVSCDTILKLNTVSVCTRKPDSWLRLRSQSEYS